MAAVVFEIARQGRQGSSVMSRTDRLEVALHHVLLRLAGRSPDGMIATARDWLARGHLPEVAEAVVYVALANGVVITPGDAGVLRAALTAAGRDIDRLATLEQVELVDMPLFVMIAVRPEPDAGWLEGTHYSLDLTTQSDLGHGIDEIDREAIAAISDPGLGGRPVAGLWRAWRCPAVATRWPPPKRLYLVQVDDPTGEACVPLTAHMQRVLGQAGEMAPQVEVFAALEDLAPYQRAALGCAALLWTGHRHAPIRVAQLFDPVNEVGGPGFSVDRPTIDDRERSGVLAYLDGGNPLLTTTALMDDVVNDRRRGVVPMTFRTDGEWVWSDATAYYLRHYGLAPDAQLLHSIRARRYIVPPVQPVALHRALAALQALTVGEAA
jgi:hypothetical protein